MDAYFESEVDEINFFFGIDICRERHFGILPPIEKERVASHILLRFEGPKEPVVLV